MASSSTAQLSISSNAAAFGLEGAWRVQALANALDAKLAKTGERVIHVELGQPDFQTPAHIIEAGIRSLQAGHTRYTTPEGIPELRDAICGFVRDRGVTTEPSRVVVAPGGKCALYCALLSIVSAGDEVLVPDPGFPMYPSVTRAAGGRPVPYPVSAATGVSADEIEQLITPRARAIVLNAPNNPAGSTIARDEMERIGALALKYNLWIVSDEIYATLQFDNGYVSPLAFSEVQDRCIIVDSLSKSHAMPGFRIGFAIVPQQLKDTFVKVVVNVFSCVTTFVQHAAVTALTGPQDCVREMRDEYQARTKLVASQLDAIPGIRCAAPAGAFYAFPNVSGLIAATRADVHGNATRSIADRILNEAYVSVLPGTDFGERGAGFVRVSCATSRANLQIAVDRIAQFAKSATATMGDRVTAAAATVSS